MASLQWNRVIGQQRVKEALSSAFERETLGHAYLFCGDTGTGTFAAALDFSMAVLCTGEKAARPCNVCSSCRKVLGFMHPDFHVVMPVPLQREHKGSDGGISEEGWSELARRVKERIADPYAQPEYASIPSIPVEWVKEMTHAIRRGATERGKNVAIIDGIDLMQKESANAMLKTLEEPPAGTLLLLCTDRPQSVLPTILSRCQILRFAALPPDIIRSELSVLLSVDPADPRLDEVSHAGSFGRARALFDQVDAEDILFAREFWECITAGEWPEVFEKIDRLGALADHGRLENIFTQLMYGIRNAFFAKIQGTENYIMRINPLSAVLTGVSSVSSLEMVAKFCETAVRRIRARANIPLALADFALSVMEIHDGKEQQRR